MFEACLVGLTFAWADMSNTVSVSGAKTLPLQSVIGIQIFGAVALAEKRLCLVESLLGRGVGLPCFADMFVLGFFGSHMELRYFQM